SPRPNMSTAPRRLCRPAARKKRGKRLPCRSSCRPRGGCATSSRTRPQNQPWWLRARQRQTRGWSTPVGCGAGTRRGEAAACVAGGGQWIELGDGVFARRHDELDLTTGLVVGAERCLVIDTRGDCDQGAELAGAVRTVTTLPWTLVYTHAHVDHAWGGEAFLPA